MINIFIYKFYFNIIFEIFNLNNTFFLDELLLYKYIVKFHIYYRIYIDYYINQDIINKI